MGCETHARGAQPMCGSPEWREALKWVRIAAQTVAAAAAVEEADESERYESVQRSAARQL
jgi:hypothetical protein